MSQYTSWQGDGDHDSSILAKDTLVALLRSLSQRVHPYFWDVNGTIDQCDSLCHFLNINERFNYLTLLENCGYGAIMTKFCAVQLAEMVGKEYCEFSEYTVYPPGKPRSRRCYLRLGCKKENADEIQKKVKEQFKKGELATVPKSVIHTCRLNKDEIRQMASLIEISLSNEKPGVKEKEKPAAKVEQHQPVMIECALINSKIPSTGKRPPSATILEPLQKKPCLSCGTSDVLQIPEPEHIAAAKALATRLSEVALQDYKLQGKIIWKLSSNDRIQINSTHRRKAHQLELLLNTVASQDIGAAGCILSCLLEKRDLNSIRAELQESDVKEKSSIDMQIVKNIKAFLQYHKKTQGGTVTSTVAAAVEAVETAIMFPSSKISPPINRITESIGYSHGRPDDEFWHCSKAVMTLCLLHLPVLL
jgi:hypothetical protein